MGRKSKFSDAQIIGFIKEIEGGATGTSIARREGVSLETMFRWRAKFGGMSVSDAKEKRRLEEENRKLRGHRAASQASSVAGIASSAVGGLGASQRAVVDGLRARWAARAAARSCRSVVVRT